MWDDKKYTSGSGGSTKLVIIVLLSSLLIGCAAGLFIVRALFPADSSQKVEETEQISADQGDGESGSAAAASTAAATAAPAETTALSETTESAEEYTSVDINEMFDQAEAEEDAGEKSDESWEESDLDEGSDDGDYILPQSSERELTGEELEGLSARDLQLARNEIYARHGRRFVTDWIQEYFDSKSWYEPVYSADEFPDSLITPVENYNIELIKSYE